MRAADESGNELMALAAGGDHRAQSELLARYRTRLRRMIEARLDRWTSAASY